MADSVIYHNPRCTTSRKALELLRDNGIEPDVIQYLKTPPSRDELVKLIGDAGIDVRTAVRKREPLYVELNLAGKKAADIDRDEELPEEGYRKLLELDLSSNVAVTLHYDTARGQWTTVAEHPRKGRGPGNHSARGPRSAA